MTLRRIFPASTARFQDASGCPLEGYSLYLYYANTTSPAPAYRDKNGVTACPWPIVLDSVGNPGDVWLDEEGIYKYVLKNREGFQFGNVVDQIELTGGASGDFATKTELKEGLNNYGILMGYDGNATLKFSRPSIPV